MMVINKIITLVQGNSEDDKERTIFERFAEINYNLSWISQ